MLGDQEFTSEKLIYPEHKYNSEQSPTCVYMPSRPMILKILRACMGVEQVEELWFNRDYAAPIWTHLVNESVGADLAPTLVIELNVVYPNK